MKKSRYLAAKAGVLTLQLLMFHLLNPETERSVRKRLSPSHGSEKLLTTNDVGERRPHGRGRHYCDEARSLFRFVNQAELWS